MRYGIFSEFNQRNERDEKVENLIQASMDGDIELVKKLVESGMSVNRTSSYGDTALSQAALKGHVDIVNFLLAKQPSPYSKNLALILACQSGYTPIVDTLIKSGADVNAYFEAYHTPLFQVIAQNKMETFQRLLGERNIDVNFEDREGIMPLLVAAFNGRLEMVKKLVDKGADLSIKNKNGETAKSMAEKNNHKHIIQLIQYIESKEHESKNTKDCVL